MSGLVLEVSGVGFEVLVPLSTFQVLPSEGDNATLLTYLHVREEELTLIGFATNEERSVFRLLLRTSGVGPRLALAALSTLTVAQLLSALAQEDVNLLRRIPGVGQKLAQKMIIELKSEASKMAIELPYAAEKPIINEAISALITLGFPQDEARRTITAAMREYPEAPSEELVRHALTMLSR